MEWLLALVWQAWNARNEWVMQGRQRPVCMMVDWTDHYFNEFVSSPNQSKQTNRENAQGPGTWQPPIQGVVAVTVDAAISQEQRKYGSGYVLRDHNGRLIVAGISTVNQRLNPPEAEARAIIHGLRTTTTLQVRKVKVQSDCQRVISLNLQNHLPMTELGLLVDEIKYLKDCFDESHFSFLPRNNNVPAHKLARYSLNFDADVMWHNEAPPWLYPNLMADLPN